MKIEQYTFIQESTLKSLENYTLDADLVLVFGEGEFFRTQQCYDTLRSKYPDANIVGCSTSGNICATHISDNDVVVNAIKFSNTDVVVKNSVLEEGATAYDLGNTLMSSFDRDKLTHVLVLCDGISINGSELAKGINDVSLDNVSITGGLAGDAARFESTAIMVNEAAKSNQVVLVGFYGNAFKAKTGCFAGWDEFGAERFITKSDANVVYEIDGKPALKLYKEYLGENAADLPGSGLRFPISIREHEDDPTIIRTLVGINEEENTLIFAGDVPQGYLCRLMKTNIDALIEHAAEAAKASNTPDFKGEKFAVLVSCVGRRLVLGQLTEEELEAVNEELGEHSYLSGFYSYGELASFKDTFSCSFHNQTMTLVTFYEEE